MAEDGAEQSNRNMKWGIYDRLKKVPPFSSPRAARVVISPRGRKMDSTEKAAETAARRMVEDHFKQENDAADPLADFVLIDTNEFLHRGHKQQNEEDISVCECTGKDGDPDSTCGSHCLNVLNNTECRPLYCPCGEQCRNQKFQQKQYAKSKLLKTANKGWGLSANADIKAADFVIEYSGEVVPTKEAYFRAKDYEAAALEIEDLEVALAHLPLIEKAGSSATLAVPFMWSVTAYLQFGDGLKDSYIVALNEAEFIDATRKGSMGRFINHSCEPNCEIRKWTVLGEDRLGVFATVDIDTGTELAYDYIKSQWYGGSSKVRCACGAQSCIGILEANSKGLQQRDAYAWEDDFERHEVDELQVSNDEDNAPLSSFIKGLVPKKLKGVSSTKGTGNIPTIPVVEKASNVPATTAKETHLVKDPPQTVSTGSPVSKTADNSTLVRRSRTSITRKGNNTLKISTAVGKLKEIPAETRLRRGITKLPVKPNALEEEEINLARKRAKSDAEAQDGEGATAPTVEQMLSENLSRVAAFQRARNAVNKQLVDESCSCFPVSEAACAEVEFAQELEMAAVSDFRKVCDDIQPAMKESQKVGQEVYLGVAQKWMEAHCKRLQSSIDFHFSIVRHLAGPTFALSQSAEVSTP